MYSYGRSSAQLAVVSNRGAYTIQESHDRLVTRRTVGGLASAVEPVLHAQGGTWISWCGRIDNSGKDRGAKLCIPPGEPRYHLQEVFLSTEEHDNYYHGFCNACLWPLCHQMPERCSFKKVYWDAYRRVNQKFARITMETRKEIYWVHDFHLALVPQLLRNMSGSATIAFFWHIPFPPPDIFQILPWGRQIIYGLLGSDLIAFHTTRYVQNFFDTVACYYPARIYPEQGLIRLHNRRILVQAIPVGINCHRFEQLAADPAVRARAEEIRRSLGAEKILLGIDRMDYTKGIPERIRAMAYFLEKHPEYCGRVTLLQIAVPSRNGIGEYGVLKQEVERLVGEINGRYDRTYGAVPVRYRYQSLDQAELVAHYLAADVLLVTALRDGLNLVAKEFAISRIDGKGVLVLSPFAGAAEELHGALLANPFEPAHLAAKIKMALEMPLQEQKNRLESLRRTIKNRDVRWWWQSNLKLVKSLVSGLSPASTSAANL
ncbi:alpha,alpha-trehalose-phosphate synthase (UDP-forming) [Desulfofundulus thermocisternus]|uniref:alpha,alpha-trehalose-phosphate synthase (UDP-forming) n=1 Tax=Desulfofundulus thermocisternus TaxID=42471 RepID=UPI0019DBA5D4|nr:trehalose-6-phosphate synthase [Desulfofundulus thermocisternus]MBE3586426.1 trehalose-6-phosphate synthase [Thermoanaerobacter sp.]MCS5696733.1 trehalose-6-phosphate synthase [Desulfofundulus thermocisternus]